MSRRGWNDSNSATTIQNIGCPLFNHYFRRSRFLWFNFKITCFSFSFTKVARIPFLWREWLWILNILLWISALATDGNPVAWREIVGCLVATIQGPTDDWDSAFLMISSIKVDHPRVTGPLDFSSLGGGIISFSGIFFLVIHRKIQMFISTLNSYTILLESGWRSEHITRLLCRFLPVVFNTQLSLSRHTSTFVKWQHSPRKRCQNVGC